MKKKAGLNKISHAEFTGDILKFSKFNINEQEIKRVDIKDIEHLKNLLEEHNIRHDKFRLAMHCGDNDDKLIDKILSLQNDIHYNVIGGNVDTTHYGSYRVGFFIYEGTLYYGRDLYTVNIIDGNGMKLVMGIHADPMYTSSYKPIHSSSGFVNITRAYDEDLNWDYVMSQFNSVMENIDIELDDEIYSGSTDIAIDSRNPVMKGCNSLPFVFIRKKRTYKLISDRKDCYIYERSDNAKYFNGKKDIYYFCWIYPEKEMMV